MTTTGTNTASNRRSGRLGTAGFLLTTAVVAAAAVGVHARAGATSARASGPADAGTPPSRQLVEVQGVTYPADDDPLWGPIFHTGSTTSTPPVSYGGAPVSTTGELVLFATHHADPNGANVPSTVNLNYGVVDPTTRRLTGVGGVAASAFDTSGKPLPGFHGLVSIDRTHTIGLYVGKSRSITSSTAGQSVKTAAWTGAPDVSLVEVEGPPPAALTAQEPTSAGLRAVKAAVDD